jgi:hypothetical protein
MAIAKGPSARARNGASLAQVKWRSSALSDLHAKRCGMRELNATETSRLKIPNVQPVRSLFMPYFDLKGKKTGFFRIRYLEPLPGFAGMVEDAQRYAQEGNTINEVYLPPLLKKSWEEIANDPDISILITEGELKAASGCSIGYATLGLGGVDVWRASKRSIDLLPALAKFKWKDRSVVFVFDSDLSENPNVVRAQRALAKELLARGARPSFASLPGAKGGGKQGLDDFIRAQGGDALEKVIEEAPPFLESDALWSMNEDYLCVDKPAAVVSRATGQLYDPSKFVSFHCANRNYIEETVKDDRVIQKKKPLATRWLGWEQRSQVARISYVPGASRYHDGTWNMWKGWGCAPKKGDIGPWKRLLDHIFGADHAARKYFEQWCAYPIQHPGAKLYVACLLFSQLKGIGKTLIAYSLMGIYGDNSVEIKSKDLKGNFNSWAKDRQFVYGDEITAGEARVDADWLKGTITQHTVMIKEKFIPDYAVSDHMNYLFSSNHLDALFVEDGDRRYFIWEILAGLPPEAQVREYDGWLGWDSNEGKATGPGPAALFHHLLNLDLTGFNPKGAAPDTPGKQSMTRASRNELALWLHELKIDPFRLLRLLGDKAAAECEVFTPGQLLKAFDPERRTKYTDVAMGRALWTARIPQLNGSIPVRTKGGFLRFYAVRNMEKWKTAKPKSIALAWERFFGPESGRY